MSDQQAKGLDLAAIGACAAVLIVVGAGIRQAWERFGDRVSDWMFMHEPFLAAVGACFLGALALLAAWSVGAWVCRLWRDGL